MTNAYYNECDPFAAAWLRNLIAAGHIADGVVDERSIVDVQPEDLIGYTQIHLFAGIGGWSLALRLAGWPDDRPVWTGSCPCPPFSVAGKRQQCPDCGSKSNLCHPRKTGHFVCLDCGCDRFADERHLWPEFARLIREQQPAIVFGEQVASADGRLWSAAVRADLETMGCAVGVADLCAAGVGAPHIRQRLYWGVVMLADATGTRSFPGSQPGIHRREEIAGPRDGQPERHSPVGRLGNTISTGLAVQHCQPHDHDPEQPTAQRTSEKSGRLANTNGDGRGAGVAAATPARHGSPAVADGRDHRGGLSGTAHSGWADADWLRCRDGKWRPVEPGTQPLAHGLPARVGRLRGYGNAIVPRVAAEFIQAFAEASETLLRGRGLDGVSAVLTDLDDLLS